jgi:hypothetical protein
MTATTIALVYIDVTIDPRYLNVDRWNIALPLAVFSAIGCVSSSIVAFAATRSPLSRQ